MSITLGPSSSESSVFAIVRRLCKVLPTAADAYTGDSIITSYANEELQLLASECRSIKTSNVGIEITTVAGQRTYDLPNNFLELVDVYLGPSGAQIRMQQASTEYLYQTFGPGFMNRQGQPFYYYIEYNQNTNKYQLGFAMVPSVTGQLITCWYVLRPLVLYASNITISALTQSAGTATATCTNQFSQGQYVTVSGAVQSGYNITAQILTASSTQFTYAVNSGTVSPATGSPVVSAPNIPQMDERLDWALCYGIAAKIMLQKRDPAFSQIYSAERDKLVAKYNDSGRKSREPLQMLNQARANPTYEI